MIRKLLILCATLIAIPAVAQTTVDKLAKPPADAKVWTITSSGGDARHGQVSLWTTPDGTQWSRMDFNLRGFVSEFDEQNRFAPDGSLESLVVRGFTPQGDAAETYEAKNGSYTFTSPVDHASGPLTANLEYVTFGGTFDSFTFIIDAMMKAPNHSVNLLPSGRGSMAPLTTLEITNGKEKKAVIAYALTGFGLSPFPIWMDGNQFFGIAGVLSFLPEGWEKAGEEMSKAQDAALAKLAPAQMAAIAKTPSGPVVFKNVKLYDSAARKFLNAMTVVVDKGIITSVGSAKKMKAPANAQIIDGAGKTLIPGLWDNHQHYGDDSTGPLLLASGITSVRDPGNQPEELMARKKRIDDGQLLGQRIVPSLLIDGPGPYTAQVAVVVHNLDEALAAVRRAKDNGYFGIKLYGSLDPAYVKPMADLAHKLGLHIHGHIPHGMRPLDAVRAGYDEITHINFVMMQAMPDDIVKTSNGMNRFIGTGKFAKDVDLHSKAMTAYLDELAKRHIAVDPTLVTFEDLYVPERGTYPPADAPYADTLPSQFSRGFLSSAMAPTAELSRESMRASFAKLKALIPELNRRHIEVLAGTDGTGFELIRELELYVEAGLTPAQALATATSNPAHVYGLWSKTGSISKGKLAELALIDGDPSKNIGDLRQVELVMRDGKLMKTSDLRATLGITGLPKR
ncbi:MAG: amidohydrolase family protein [Proteobacteria bacterium]|nr:amidohydrolase family protein [Pseudomonadota bacterium]